MNGMEEYDDIDFSAILRKLHKEWRLILVFCAAGLVIGIVAALSVVSTYTVTAKISPEITGRNSNSQLNSLANIAGVNLGNLYSSDAISPELYPDIVASVPFLTGLFDMPVTAVYKGEPVECNYYEYVVNCRKSPWYSFVLSLPMRAVNAVTGIFAKDEGDDEEEDEDPSGFKTLHEIDNEHLSKAQAGVVAGMRNRVKVITDKKIRLVTLSVTEQDPEIARELADAIIENIRSFFIDYRTEKARKDLAYYEQLYVEAQAEYFDAQRKYANYVDKNQGLALRSVMIERERLQNEAQLKYQLYNSCAQQVQMAKAQVQRETPVCAVITPPTVPLRDNESGIRIILTFVLIGLLLASLWILWGRDWLYRLKNPVEFDKE